MLISVTPDKVHENSRPRNLTNPNVHILWEPSCPCRHSLSSVNIFPKEPVFHIIHFATIKNQFWALSLGVTKSINSILGGDSNMSSSTLRRNSFPCYLHYELAYSDSISFETKEASIWRFLLNQSPLPVPFHCELDPDKCADSVLSWTVFLAPPKDLAEEGGVFWGRGGGSFPQWMETDTQQFFTQQQAMWRSSLSDRLSRS